MRIEPLTALLLALSACSLNWSDKGAGGGESDAAPLDPRDAGTKPFDGDACTPAARELCNGVDDDCDRKLDEGFADLGDPCKVGKGSCEAPGEVACSVDGTATVCAGEPLSAKDEVCFNALDEDCDGVADDGCKVVQVAAGGHVSCAVVSDGSLWCWGENAYGALGIGSADEALLSAPTPVTSLSKVLQVSVRADHVCAVHDLNQLSCWGRGEVGQLGLGDDGNRAEPVLVDLTNVEQVAAGIESTCAIRTGGGVFCWGLNLDGALGVGTSAETCLYAGGNIPCQQVPLIVPGLGNGLPKAVQLDMGLGNVCAVLEDTSLVCWGKNQSGELGLGSNASDFESCGLTQCKKVPTALVFPGSPAVQQVSTASTHACAIGGSDVWCFGSNLDGKLGLGNENDRATPQRVTSSDTYVSVSVGGSHSCAITSNGQLDCWGSNERGELGINDPATSVNAPRRVTLADEVRAVAAGLEHTCAALEDGSLYCWGRNDHGQLGLGSAQPAKAGAPQRVVLTRR